MKTTLVFTLIFFTVSLFIFIPHTAAENLRELEIPEGAFARLGEISNGSPDATTYSPDGSLIAQGGNGVYLYDTGTGEEHAFLPTQNIVRTLFFSPDGKTLASYNADQTVTLWDVRTLTEIVTFMPSRKGFWTLAFSPDSKMLITISSTEIRLWDVATGTLKSESLGNVLGPPSLGGKTLLINSTDDPYSTKPTIRLLDVSTLTEKNKLEISDTWPEEILLSPDGKTFVTVTRDQTVRTGYNNSAPTYKAVLRDATTLAEIATLTWFPNRKNLMRFSPDSKVLVTADHANAANSYNTLRLWDATTGVEIGHLTADEPVSEAYFSPDSKRLVTTDGVNLEDPANSYNTLRLWDATTSAKIATLTHTDHINDVRFSADSKTLVSSANDTIHFWDATTGGKIAELSHPSRPISVKLSPDSKTFVSFSYDKSVRLWNATTLTETATLLQPSGYSAVHVEFSPDGKTIATKNTDGSVRLWDIATQREIATIPRFPFTPTTVPADILFSPDEKTIAIYANFSETVYLWNITTGTQTATLTHSEPVQSIWFNPDGSRLICRSTNRGRSAVYLWDATNGTEVAHREVSINDISPDGKTIAVWKDGIVHLWDVATFTEIATLRHEHGVYGVRFSPKEKIIAGTTGRAQDASVRLWEWDVATFTEIATLTGHTDRPSLTFSPDGNTLASKSGGEVRLWNVFTKSLLHILPEGAGWGGNVIFSPDGKRIVDFNRDRTAILWDVTTGRKIATLPRDSRFENVRFSPDSKILINEDRPGTLYGTLYLWNAATGAQINPYRVSGMSVSRDGRTLLTYSRGGVLRLWDIITQTEIVRLSCYLGGEGSVITSGVTTDHILTRSQVAHKTVVDNTRISGIGGMSVSPDSTTLAVISAGTVLLYHITPGGYPAAENREKILYQPVTFTEGTLLAIANFGNDEVSKDIYLYDLSTGEEKARLPTEGIDQRFVRLSPDGKMLASSPQGQGQKTFHLWDITTRSKIATVAYNTGTVNEIGFSPDSKTLAIVEGWSRNPPHRVHLWDVATQTEIAKIEVPNETPSIDFSPDSKTLAIGSPHLVILWDIATRTRKSTLSHSEASQPGKASSVRFSPDGKTLASGDGEGMIVLWDIATETRKVIIRHPRNPDGRNDLLRDMRFSPDGKTLVSEGSKLYFWDTASGVQRWNVPPGIVINLHQHPNDNCFWDIATAKLNDVLSQHKRIGQVLYQRISGYSPDKSLVIGLGPNLLLWRGEPAAGFTEAPTPTKEPTILVGDVNADGEVNIQDLIAVEAALETSENDADVNGDGNVNIRDLIAVAAAISEAAAAPSAIYHQAIAQLTPANVQQWLTQARRLNLTDATSLRGIRFLEQLLSTLIPKETTLLPNYPNPFNPETWIPYQLAKPAGVTLTIYAIDGKLVRTLDLGHQRPGIYQSRSRAAYWDGRNQIGESVASGVYFYTLTTNDFTATRKMFIRK